VVGFQLEIRPVQSIFAPKLSCQDVMNAVSEGFIATKNSALSAIQSRIQGGKKELESIMLSRIRP